MLADESRIFAERILKLCLIVLGFGLLANGLYRALTNGYLLVAGTKGKARVISVNESFGRGRARTELRVEYRVREQTVEATIANGVFNSVPRVGDLIEISYLADVPGNATRRSWLELVYLPLLLASGGWAILKGQRRLRRGSAVQR